MNKKTNKLGEGFMYSNSTTTTKRNKLIQVGL